MIELLFVGIGILSLLCYSYRHRLLLLLLSSFWYLATLYINYKVNNCKESNQQFKCIRKRKISFADTTFCVYEYIKDKVGLKVFGCCDEEPLLINIEEKYRQNILFRHNVLNCSIDDSYDEPEDSCLLDITNLWRECLYHYHGGDEQNKLKYLFMYISSNFKIENIKDKYLVTYVNDENFTQYKYKIADIWDRYFYEINKVN